MNSKNLEKQISYCVVLVFVLFVIVFKILGWEMKSIVSLFSILVIIVIVLVIIGLIINAMIASKKLDAGIKRLKDKGYFAELRLDYVYETPNGLLLVASLDRVNMHYKFVSCYAGNASGIQELIESKKIENIKVWVDLLFLDLYEIDLDDLFIKIGKSFKLESKFNVSTRNLKEANELINDYKKMLL